MSSIHRAPTRPHAHTPTRCKFHILQCLTLVLVVLSAATARAQVPLLDYLPASRLTTLTETQQKNIAIAEAIPGVNGSWLVEVAAISELPLGQSFTLSLPELACMPRVATAFYGATSDSTWEYHAAIDLPISEADSACLHGSIHLDIAGGGVTGALYVDTRRFEIHHIGGGLEVLLERDISDLGLRCGTDDQADSLGREAAVLRPRTNGDKCEAIRVVAVYTDSARLVVPDIFGTIRLAINQTNQVYRNSDISAAVASLQLVHIVPIEYVSESEAWIEMGKLLGSPQIINARHDNKADIVVAFTGRPEGQPTYLDGIVGSAGTLTLNPAKALTFVLADFANVEYTAAHEISHLFGCRHQIAWDPTGPIEHAYRIDFRFPSPYRLRRQLNTTMWGWLTGETVGILSNPDVVIWGNAFGTASANNAQQICNNACTVADFFGSGPTQNQPLVVRITGPSTACTCIDVLLGSQVTPATVGPYTYAWRVSNDGVNYGPVVSTFAKYALTLSCDPRMRTFAQLTVTDSRSQTSTHTHSVLTHDKLNDKLCPRSARETPSDVMSVPTAMLYPNPAGATVFVADSGAVIDTPGPRTAEILDLFGRRIQTTVILTNVEGVYPVDISSLSPGAYLIRWPNVPTPLRLVKTAAQ